MSDDGGVLEFSNNESAMRCMAILVDIQKSVMELALSLASLEKRISRIEFPDTTAGSSILDQRPPKIKYRIRPAINNNDKRRD